MHNVSYAIVFIANFYTATRIFGLGWSVGPASFSKEASIVALITVIAGFLSAFTKKANWKTIALCSAIGPASVCGLMAQGILQNRAFELLHWLLIPIGGAALTVLSFITRKKIFKRQELTV